MSKSSEQASFRTYSFIGNLILKTFLSISTVISLLDEEKAAAY